MNRRTIAALAATAASLAVPSLAGAHVTVHPNVLPEGAYVVVNVRVPNETEDANTTSVAVQMPPGVEFASVAPPEGWTANVKQEGKEVSELEFSGGKLPPGQFLEFPVSMQVPGKAGDTLTFKAVQTYDDGEVVRWIGSPDADKPAPTVNVSEAGGLIEDSTGEHGVTHDDTAATEEAATEEAAHETETEAAAAPATTTVVEEESSDGLAIAALIVGGLGLAVGGVALVRSRKA